ncbi:MAG: hypothetical protein JW953_23535 [Anaerolineae bacterium]|nr:hypothetical protein [Anaerolineae bacterium]
MNTVEINWTVITYFVIGLFALSGFLKGWWKEAITLFFLGSLVFLLKMPEVAQTVIDWLNRILQTVWGWLPLSIQEFLANVLGITSFQIDAGSGMTWLAVLIFVLGLSVLLSRLLLPNHLRTAKTYYTYTVTPLGSFLGGLLGGLNGFLIINLVKEYLDGSNLPTGAEEPATEVAVAGGQTVGIASSGVGLEVIDLPNFTQISHLLTWGIIGFALLLLVLVFRSRVFGPKQPFGYQRGNIKKEKEDFVIVPAIVPVKKKEGN